MMTTITTPFWRWRCEGGRWRIVNVRQRQRPTYGAAHWMSASR